MNIFVVHENPNVAASLLCNRHVTKMTLESTQMLCTALRQNKVSEDTMRTFGIVNSKGEPYGATHVNHPCTRWVTLSTGSFDWLLAHGLSLATEYGLRYRKQHACIKPLLGILSLRSSNLFPPFAYTDRTPFVQAMPDAFKVEGDAVKAYRRFYQEKLAGWTEEGRPPRWPWAESHEPGIARAMHDHGLITLDPMRAGHRQVRETLGVHRNMPAWLNVFNRGKTPCGTFMMAKSALRPSTRRPDSCSEHLPLKSPPAHGVPCDPSCGVANGSSHLRNTSKSRASILCADRESADALTHFLWSTSGGTGFCSTARRPCLRSLMRSCRDSTGDALNAGMRGDFIIDGEQSFADDLRDFVREATPGRFVFTLKRATGYTEPNRSFPFDGHVCAEVSENATPRRTFSAPSAWGEAQSLMLPMRFAHPHVDWLPAIIVGDHPRRVVVVNLRRGWFFDADCISLVASCIYAGPRHADVRPHKTKRVESVMFYGPR